MTLSQPLQLALVLGVMLVGGTLSNLVGREDPPVETPWPGRWAAALSAVAAPWLLLRSGTLPSVDLVDDATLAVIVSVALLLVSYHVVGVPGQRDDEDDDPPGADDLAGGPGSR
ncbi:hypothetical protein RYH80_17365 [Halobaculum sp. MBLA0147]|uniref:hypothetical protein n=1 Tax=Halobaculum sp. MBLA0147 TaxID=3079934 RepID=UPI003524036A